MSWGAFTLSRRLRHLPAPHKRISIPNHACLPGHVSFGRKRECVESCPIDDTGSTRAAEHIARRRQGCIGRCQRSFRARPVWKSLWQYTLPTGCVNINRTADGAKQCRARAGSASCVGCDAEAAYPCRRAVSRAAPSAVLACDHSLATPRRYWCCVAGLPWHTGSQWRSMPPAVPAADLPCADHLVSKEYSCQRLFR